MCIRQTSSIENRVKKLFDANNWEPTVHVIIKILTVQKRAVINIKSDKDSVQVLLEDSISSIQQNLWHD